MFSVVNRGQNIMHSDGEFRSNYVQQFPGCIAPPPGVGVSVQASSLRVPSIEIVNASRFYQAMEVMIRNQQRITETLQSQTIFAGKIAARYRENKARICDTCLMRLLAPIRLKAQVRYSGMISDVFRKRVALSKDSAASAIYSEKNIEQSALDLNRFEEDLKKITTTMLEQSLTLINQNASRIPEQTKKQLTSYFNLKIKLLQIRGPRNNELYSMLELPVNPYGDQAIELKSRPVKASYELKK